ncbi:MAG: site-specific integrase [Gammaproteobacteria bacterium]|nr:site-specific integrase [Gammaproteobacteria bacterium]
MVTNTTTTFAVLLESFFTDRLMQQRKASPHTIASYRDTFRLLLQYAQSRMSKAPTDLAMEDLGCPFITAFLNHLEEERGNSARSRNVRLAAIHAFFRYVALYEPRYCALAQQVLAIPSKRYTQRPISFLTQLEVEALLEAPDPSTWIGLRDRTLLLLAVQTGLRASELIGLCVQDIVFGTGAHVRCLGKGRKERCTPLRKDTVAALRCWLQVHDGQAGDALFPNVRGRTMSHDGLAFLLGKHLTTAREHCTSLRGKRVTPHTLRHSAAMRLLERGVDNTVIALWLGHESVETTYVYLHADLKLKEKALATTTPSKMPVVRYRPDDKLLAFLNGL